METSLPNIFLILIFAAGILVVYGLLSHRRLKRLELLYRDAENRIESMIEERKQKLLGSSKYSELGMMAAGIAHEINNPLAVIQARTTQLLRIYKDPQRYQELADGLQQILYTSERINRTIQGVREFVHQDEKAPKIEIKIKDIVEDVLAFCGQRLKNHGVNLRLYGIENFTVWGNKIQLEQIILNLLNNSFDAIEFLPDKWIELSVHKKNGKIQIFVKDSGHGISPEIAIRMMDPFFSTKDVGKGTGLGLALARGIAERHGGQLHYLSEAPHTTFMLELPESGQLEWNLPMVH
jgi:C4-dicarboxylate-specific signal transduction histidine kinase